MVDSAFIPFVPRRASVPEAQSEILEPAVGDVADVADEAQCDSQQPPGAAGDIVEMVEPSAAEPELPSNPQPPDRPPCDHRREIRNEAVRLAAVACGRALRHAVAIDPSVLARFVDDAIAASGNTKHALVRVHPDLVRAVARRGHECIADDSVALGEVVVEAQGASVAANLDERAEVLARAAADAHA